MADYEGAVVFGCDELDDGDGIGVGDGGVPVDELVGEEGGVIGLGGGVLVGHPGGAEETLGGGVVEGEGEGVLEGVRGVGGEAVLESGGEGEVVNLQNVEHVRERLVELGGRAVWNEASVRVAYTWVNKGRGRVLFFTKGVDVCTQGLVYTRACPCVHKDRRGVFTKRVHVCSQRP